MTDRAELQLITFPAIVELIGTSPSIERARLAIERASRGLDAVLLAGEPGLDADAVARVIHDGRATPAGPLSAVDCAAGDAVSLGVDLFARSQPNGTLVLANLDELPTPLQVRLARAMRDGQVEIDASGRVVAFDAQVIASVNGNVDEAMHEGRLRRELYRRFSLRVDLPPLRHRPADIPMLIGCLVGDAAIAARLPVPTFSREALTLLSALPWRRNFDELREVLDLLVRAAVGGSVRLEDVLDLVPVEPVSPAHSGAGSLRDARVTFERRYIASVLQRHHGRMEDAARSLGIQRANLYRKIRQLGIGRMRAG